MNFEEAIQWIHSIGRFGVKPGLERITALLEHLGNPHHKLSFVHIGGTNGKGSTAAILSSILEASGYQVGLYTSPYLEAFNNRIAINGEDISQEKLVEHVKRVKPVVEKVAAVPDLGHPTEFEVVTALALDYYASLKPDLVILEVGLGGRLDATNIVTPLASVITNVSLDHTSVLGDTVEEVTFEKAGIIKDKVPVLTTASDPVVQNLLKETASQKQSPFYQVVNSYSSEENYEKNLTFSQGIIKFRQKEILAGGQRFDYSGLNATYNDLFLSLIGSYQVANAALALAIVEVLNFEGFHLNEDSVRYGLTRVSWPGRMEVMQESPLLVLDGAHNPAAIQELSRAIKDFFKYERLVLVMGIMEDKDVKGVMGNIIHQADLLILTRPELPRAADPHVLRDKLVEEGNMPHILVELDIKQALGLALSSANEDDLVLVTGSFFTISDARDIYERYFLKKS